MYKVQYGGQLRYVYPDGTVQIFNQWQSFKNDGYQLIKYTNERLADGRPFLMGERPTVADCTLAAGLQFGRFGKVEVDANYTHLHRWNDRYRERPSAREVLVV